MQHSSQENHRPSPFFVHSEEPREGQRRGGVFLPHPTPTPPSEAANPVPSHEGSSGDVSLRTQVCWPGGDQMLLLHFSLLPQPCPQRVPGSSHSTAGVLMPFSCWVVKERVPENEARLQRWRDGVALIDVVNPCCLNSGRQPGLKLVGWGSPRDYR